MNDGTNLRAQTDAQPVEPSSPAERQERLAAWLQFPRRVILLLIAFGLALALIAALQGPLRPTTLGRQPPTTFGKALAGLLVEIGEFPLQHASPSPI